MESNNAKFLANGNFSRSHDKRDMVLILESKEISETSHPNNDTIILTDTQSDDHQILRRSKRTRTNAVSNDYLVYLREQNGQGIDDDPLTFLQAISCSESNQWMDTMKSEMASMQANQVWELVELLKGVISM